MKREPNLKIRVIPILLLKEGALVRSRKFNYHQITGDPFLQVERFNNWNVDELIYLDISRSGKVDTRDSNNVIGAASAKCRIYEDAPKDIYEFISFLSKKCFMPLTFGGGLTNIEQVRKILQSGADKVAINTEVFKRPEFITEIVEKFGSQCLVVSIDCKKTDLGYEVFIEGGKTATGVNVVEWSKKATELGAGELLINSIDKDGIGSGYDCELYRSVIDQVNIPVIICGGVGTLKHFSKVFEEIEPHAVAAANFFHFIEHSDIHIKKHLHSKNINVRVN